MKEVDFNVSLVTLLQNFNFNEKFLGIKCAPHLKRLATWKLSIFLAENYDWNEHILPAIHIIFGAFTLLIIIIAIIPP